MKGIIFTEFLEMVETRMSPDVADEIIRAAKLPNDGAYTAVGTYDPDEMTRLVAELSRKLQSPVPQLLRAFGAHLFGRFVQLYPRFFEGTGSAFDFLRSVDSYIHMEVQKLYGDAQLPRFECTSPSPGRLIMVYRSSRGMADLAEGLIEGCARHFGARIRIGRRSLGDPPGTHVEFLLTMEASP